MQVAKIHIFHTDTLETMTIHSPMNQHITNTQVGHGSLYAIQSSDI